MKIINSMPFANGYTMPAEFEKHSGTIIVWPERKGSWIYNAKFARVAFSNVIKAISENETVFVAVSADTMEIARSFLQAEIDKKTVVLFEMKTDDSWARDIAPTFVKNGSSVRGIDWKFNAWGGDYDGLYSDYSNDNAFASAFCNKFGFDYYDAQHFVCEGGSIHSNGQGTFIVTEACLLSKGRNPNLNKEQIEKVLYNFLGARKIIWLPHGIYGDETNEHVDNVCAFTSPTEVVLAWTDDKSDEQYNYSLSAYETLISSTDANGNKLLVRKLPIPKNHVVITEFEAKGYEYSLGETERTVGERLSASYVNFYVCNNAVILPSFNDEMDEVAISVMKKAFPTRKIIPIYAKDILVGGGNIHCITQQIPQGDEQ